MTMSWLKVDMIKELSSQIDSILIAKEYIVIDAETWTAESATGLD